MFREQFTGLLHAMKDAFREFGLAKMSGHGFRQFLPKLIPAFCMNRFIADDGKLVRRGEPQKSARRSGRGFVHAEMQKFRLGSSHRVINMFGTDADANFAGGLVFGIVDRRDNVVVVQML